MKFELKRLDDYSDGALLNEVRRVAHALGKPTVTRKEFSTISKVATSTLCRRFGSWQAVLQRAGYSASYVGPLVSDKMKRQLSRKTTNEQLLAEIVRVSEQLKSKSLSQSDFNRLSHNHSSKAIISRFGSWKAALSRIGLSVPAHGRRYSEDDYYENLLSVWTHYGRQPNYGELNLPPSHITSGAYEKKWGGWRKALVAFTTKVNSPEDVSPVLILEDDTRNLDKPSQPSPNVRSMPIGLRYNVLRRDRFRCVICGASPATNLNCSLHVDHIIPVSRNGKTVSDNLRTLCQDCNLGKSSKNEFDAAT